MQNLSSIHGQEKLDMILKTQCLEFRKYLLHWQIIYVENQEYYFIEFIL